MSKPLNKKIVLSAIFLNMYFAGCNYTDIRAIYKNNQTSKLYPSSHGLTSYELFRQDFYGESLKSRYGIRFPTIGDDDTNNDESREVIGIDVSRTCLILKVCCHELTAEADASTKYIDELVMAYHQKLLQL